MKSRLLVLTGFVSAMSAFGAIYPHPDTPIDSLKKGTVIEVVRPLRLQTDSREGLIEDNSRSLRYPQISSVTIVTAAPEAGQFRRVPAARYEIEKVEAIADTDGYGFDLQIAPNEAGVERLRLLGFLYVADVNKRGIGQFFQFPSK